MRSWINTSTSQEKISSPTPGSGLKLEGVAEQLFVEESEQSCSPVIKQLFATLRQVQAALTAGRELVKVEFDLLRQELGGAHPAKGILHKAVDIIRHKVTEQGQVVLSSTGWALLTRLDQLIDLLPEDE